MKLSDNYEFPETYNQHQQFHKRSKNRALKATKLRTNSANEYESVWKLQYPVGVHIKVNQSGVAYPPVCASVPGLK